MKQVLKNERGMALAVAIVALVIVGALVAGAFFSGTQEQRVAENARRVQASFGIAEQGAYEMIRTWPDSVIRYQGLGLYPSNAPASTKTLGTTYTWSSTGSFGGTLYKLNNELFLVDVTGRDVQSLGGNIRGGGASQRVGLLATIRPLNIDIQASLTTANSDRVSGNSTIDG